MVNFLDENEEAGDAPVTSPRVRACVGFSRVSPWRPKKGSVLYLFPLIFRSLIWFFCFPWKTAFGAWGSAWDCNLSRKKGQRTPFPSLHFLHSRICMKAQVTVTVHLTGYRAFYGRWICMKVPLSGLKASHVGSLLPRRLGPADVSLAFSKAHQCWCHRLPLRGIAM